MKSNIDCGNASTLHITPKSLLNCTLHVPCDLEAYSLGKCKKDCTENEETHFSGFAYPTRFENLIIEKKYGKGTVFFVSCSYMYSRFYTNINMEFERVNALTTTTKYVPNMSLTEKYTKIDIDMF